MAVEVSPYYENNVYAVGELLGANSDALPFGGNCSVLLATGFPLFLDGGHLPYSRQIQAAVVGIDADFAAAHPMTARMYVTFSNAAGTQKLSFVSSDLPVNADGTLDMSDNSWRTNLATGSDLSLPDTNDSQFTVASAAGAQYLATYNLVTTLT